MKNILIVVDSLDSNHSSGAKANLALVQNLAALGYALTIVHQSGRAIQINQATLYLVSTQKISLTYLLSRTQRVFTQITKWNINPLIESIFGFSFTFFNDVKSFKKTLKKLEHQTFDKVITLSYAASFRPHAAVLKMPKLHGQWIAYVHDPYPMHSYPRPYDWVEPGHQKKRNFFLKICKNAFQMAYPSLLLAEWMESYYHEAKGKRLIIPHQISHEVFEPQLLEEFGDVAKFRILHAGNLMSARNPMGLVQGFELFLKNNPTAKTNSLLLIVGNNGIYESELTNASKRNSAILAINTYQPFAKIQQLQKEVSINVVLEAKGAISPFLPGKVPHCVVANKPMLLLGPYYSETKRLLGATYPYWCEIDDVAGITHTIEQMYQQWLLNPSAFMLNRPDLNLYLKKINLEPIV